MSATIVKVYGRTIVVVISVGIVAIDGESPSATIPKERVEEIIGSSEDSILPVEQNVTKVGITIGEITTVNVVGCLYAEQIVEVDLVAVFVLLVVEVQLIGHLVGEEQSLLASLLVVHCMQRDSCEETHEECRE